MIDKNIEGENLSFKTFRIIDANLNRLREGIRVIEDIARYVNNDEVICKQLKNLRHKTKISFYDELLKSRDIQRDVLKETTKEESARQDLKQVFIANIKRAQESSRVLEEILKLSNIKEAEKFKEIRYSLYQVEKTFTLLI